MWTIRADHFRSCLLFLLALSQLFAVGCHGTGGIDWRPEEFIPSLRQVLPFQRRQDLWEQWAADNLQSGDLLFILGESRILMGLVNFSKLTTDLADSRFSHVAVVSRENGEFVVYDIMIDGPRRTPFGQFMADRRVWEIAVKRLRPEYRAHIPRAIAYCQQVYESDTPFDENFRLDNGSLYCTEFIELAFRHAGLPLSEPVRIDQLPGFDQVSDTTVRLVRAATSIDPEQKILLPGNERTGVWSCPCLELVLDATDASSPPKPPPLTGSSISEGYGPVDQAHTPLADRRFPGQTGTVQASGRLEEAAYR